MPTIVAWTRHGIIGTGYGTCLRVARSAEATEHVCGAGDHSDRVARIGQGQVVVGTGANGECDVRQLFGQLAEIGEVCDGIFGSGDELDRDVDVREPSAALGRSEHLPKGL